MASSTAARSIAKRSAPTRKTSVSDSPSRAAIASRSGRRGGPAGASISNVGTGGSETVPIAVGSGNGDASSDGGCFAFRTRAVRRTGGFSDFFFLVMVTDSLVAGPQDGRARANGIVLDEWTVHAEGASHHPA